MATVGKAVNPDQVRAYRELVRASLLAERRGVLPGGPNFGLWLEHARPEMRWDYPHFLEMQRVLNRVTSGDCRRAVFQVAVRHGKTEHNTISYSTYRLERDPTTRVLLGTYSQPQARKLSRSVRRLLRNRETPLSQEVSSVDDWETEEGGGVRAVGRGSGVASVNADLIIIDDPIGSRAEAESEATREATWDWITDDILARAEPHTQVLFSMPRWHIDDPMGRMLDRQSGRWHVVDMPGVAELDDWMGRPPGALLWEELRPQSWMDEMMVDLGSYGFASLVQGRPTPREGGMFKWEWWGNIPEVPAIGPMIRYWDLAGTDPTPTGDPDYTSGGLLCRMTDGRTAICDMSRFRLSVAKRDAKIREVCKVDLKSYYGRVLWWIETETGIQGKERTANLVQSLVNLGMAVRTEHPTGSKRSRAEPLAAAAESGNVVLVEGPWNDPFRLEAGVFTGKGGPHDDQIDAAAGAFAKLSIPRATISHTHVSV